MANTKETLGFLGQLFIAQRIVREAFPSSKVRLTSGHGETKNGQPTRDPREISKLSALFNLTGYVTGRVHIETLPSGEWGIPRLVEIFLPEPALPLLINLIDLDEAFKRLDTREPNAQVKSVVLTSYPGVPTALRPFRQTPFYNFTVVKGGGVEEHVRIYARRLPVEANQDAAAAAKAFGPDGDFRLPVITFEDRVAFGVRKVEKKFGEHNPVLKIVIGTTANGQPATSSFDVDTIELVFSADGISSRIIIQAKDYDEWGEPVLTSPGLIGDVKLNEPLDKTLQDAYDQLEKQTKIGFVKVVISATYRFNVLPISIANYAFSLPDGRVIVIPELDKEVRIN